MAPAMDLAVRGKTRAAPSSQPHHAMHAQRPLNLHFGSVLIGLCLWSCNSNPDRPDDPRWLVAHGRHAEAVRVAAAAVERDPGSPEAIELHKQASVAYLLDLARAQSFRDEDDAALATIEQAARIAPGNEEVRDWREKTNQKLAWTWRGRAFDLHAEDDIDAALEAYEKALKHVPGDPATLEGRNIALALVSHRSGLGRTYFQQGLEALSDLWLDQARSRFSYARKYRPADERATQRETQVKRLIAARRSPPPRRTKARSASASRATSTRRRCCRLPTTRRPRSGSSAARSSCRCATCSVACAWTSCAAASSRPRPTWPRPRP